MNHLNNYSQIKPLKSIVFVLVIVMLIGIPNLHVYSSIGSYKTHSPAIMANVRCNSSSKENSLNFPAIGVVVASVAIITGISVICVALNGLDSEDGSVYGSIPPPISTFENYGKHDFSEFDN